MDAALINANAKLMAAKGQAHCIGKVPLPETTG